MGKWGVGEMGAGTGGGSGKEGKESGSAAVDTPGSAEKQPRAPRVVLFQGDSPQGLSRICLEQCRELQASVNEKAASSRIKVMSRGFWGSASSRLAVELRQ